MRKRRTLVVTGLVTGILLAGMLPSSAAPKTGFPLAVECPSGSYEAMGVPGQGWWVPAIVTSGPARVLHPVGFEGFHGRVIDPATNEVVAQFDDDEVDYRRNAFRHPHGYERCEWSATFLIGPDDEDFPEGFIAEIGGTVLGRIAPPRR